eukprot:2531054-Prymnesium_polylepis.2
MLKGASLAISTPRDPPNLIAPGTTVLLRGGTCGDGGGIGGGGGLAPLVTPGGTGFAQVDLNEQEQRARSEHCEQTQRAAPTGHAPRARARLSFTASVSVSRVAVVAGPPE